MKSTVPFPYGQTMFGGSPSVATDGAAILGHEYEIEDAWFSSGRIMRLRAVRNSSGIVILPKMRVLLNAAGTAITGYTRLPSERGPHVDHLVPSAGVATNDILWVVVRGPALGVTSMSDISVDITALEYVNGQTAAASTHSTTAGRVKNYIFAAGTADATASSRNETERNGIAAKAVSTKLTNATNADILVDVDYRI